MTCTFFLTYHYGSKSLSLLLRNVACSDRKENGTYNYGVLYESY